MKNYCMITEGRFVKTYLPVHLQRASEFVDRFVFVDDGTFPPDAKEYLSKYTNKEIVILTRKWDNCHVCQRNVYIDFLKKQGGDQWCLVMDSDEFPSVDLLKFYKGLNEKAGYETPSHDIRIPYSVSVDPVFVYFFGSSLTIEESVPKGEEPPNEVKEITDRLGIQNYSFTRQFDFRKLNIFYIFPETQYVGTVHERLDGVPIVKKVDYPYYHIKAMWEIHRDGFRNYVEGGSGVNLHEKNPHWIQMKKMLPTTNWHEVRTLKDLTMILLWLYLNAGDTGNEWSSETYDIYMYLRYALRTDLPFKYEKQYILENPARPEIEKLYKIILKREPDPGGLSAYSEEFYRRSIDELIESMLKSKEFVEKYKEFIKEKF